MSDIRTIFVTAAFTLVVGLPVTTAIMVGLGVAAYRIHRREPTRRLTGIKWKAIAMAPFWLGGVVFGGLMLFSIIHAVIEEAPPDSSKKFTTETGEQ